MFAMSVDFSFAKITLIYFNILSFYFWVFMGLLSVMCQAVCVVCFAI